MISWLLGKAIPSFDHGDMTSKELWYLRGDPEPVLLNRKVEGFSAPRPGDMYEIHFSLSEHYSPKHEDRSYDTKYKFKKHGQTRFTQEEAAKHIKWMTDVHHRAHAD